MANARATTYANNIKAKALMGHDYCGPQDMETNARGMKNLLTSPSKSSAAPKKQRGEGEKCTGAQDRDASNAAILAAIVNLQTMMEGFKEEQKQHTLTMANIAKAVEFNSGEIKDCKENNKKLGEEVKQLREKNTELEKRAAEVERRAADLERYKRRWNLRLNGLKEKKEEDTRQIVADIIGKIVPRWRENMDLILDSVHRLGPNNTERPRQIIMQFTGRHFRDELWRTTKQHQVCRDLNIRFAEDLTKEDREARRAVWPKVEQARKAGLKTSFRGPYAFINGQRVAP